MQVFRPPLSGFCPGVTQAANRLLEFTKNLHGDPVYLLGELIHSHAYMQHLAAQGIRIVEDPFTLPRWSRLVVRTHGIDRYLEEELLARYRILDLTCPKVKRVQKLIRSVTNDQVVILGHKTHPEVIGLKSYSEAAVVLENGEEALDFIRCMKRLHSGKSEVQGITIVSQTTGTELFFNEITERISSELGNLIPVTQRNTICPVTGKKEKEALAMQPSCDFSIVIGDAHSANANKLYERLHSVNPATLFVDSLATLRQNQAVLNSIQSVMVVSSASTPPFIEKQLISFLESL